MCSPPPDWPGSNLTRVNTTSHGSDTLKLSSILKWIVILVLLIAVCAGGVLCWAWINSDRLVQDALVRSLEQKAPGWNVELGHTRFDGVNKVHVHDIVIRDPNSGEQLAHIPEFTATVDRDEFLRSQQVIIQKVRVRAPTVRLHRHADGTWNWQGLPKLKMGPHRNLPEWSIENAKFDVSLDYGSNFPEARFALAGGYATLIPADSRTFDFRGGLSIEQAGDLKLAGRWNLDEAGWKIAGKMNDVIADDRLMKLAADTSPELRDRLEGLHQSVQNTANRIRGEHTRLASTQVMPLGSSDGALSFGVSGLMDVKFAISQKPQSDLNYQVLLGLAGGTVDNDILPFNLHDVNAIVYRDNERMSVQVKNAKNDQTQLSLEANIVTNAQGQPSGAVRMNIADMPLDDRLRNMLPRSLRRVLDPLNATGNIWANGAWIADGSGKWIPRDVRLELRDGTSQFDKFRYPAQNVNGTLTQVGDSNVFAVDFRGTASGQPVKLIGQIKNPGPSAEVRLGLSCNSLPLDEKFHSAWDERSRPTVDAMGIQGGLADSNVLIYRPPLVGAKTVVKVNTTIREGRMTYGNFPFPLEHVTGQIVYTSHNRSWKFLNLTGNHGQSRIAASGSVDGSQQPSVLHMDMRVENGRFTRDLRAALSPGLQDLWDHLSPTGAFGCDIDIDWLAASGQPALVSIPDMLVQQGRIKPDSFPYEIDNIQARMSYQPRSRQDPNLGQVTITRLLGRHRNTTIDAAGWGQHNAAGDWTLHFDKLTAKNVIANDDLKLALPEGLRDAIHVLNPTAPFGIENTQLEFRGRADPSVPVTAAWETETVLDGGAISAGMDLRKVRGRVTNRGSYGPNGLINKGRVTLSSVEVLGYTLTDVAGPYEIKDSDLVIGSRNVFRKSPQSVPVSERITAKAFGGQLTCDGLVSLSEPQAYRVFVTTKNSDLGEYARLHMPQERTMSGKMNGWVYLHGLGDDENNIKGSGQLQVSPAAIYEMPVMVNLMNALGTLNFSVPDRVAFRHALLNFNVENSSFVFNQIDLIGNALSLRGRGRVGFDSRINLDFFSKPKNTGGIPILSQLVSSATTGWVNVTVDGTLDNPKTRVQPKFNPDGQIRPFLQAFDPMMPPQLRVPRIGR